jgi:enolase
MDRNWTRYEMINLYKEIDNKFPMISIEDPLDEEDFEGFAILQKELPNIKIIGDDLTVTNVKRLSIAIKFNAIQGLIIKPNQIGTLSETIQTIKIAHENNLVCIVSHRSGETMDDFIADLAFAFGCFGLKSGAWGPKERNVKYEKLIKITSDN